MIVLKGLVIILRLAEEENQLLIVMLIHFIRLKGKTTETNSRMVEDQSEEWITVLSKTFKTT